jgi:membrane protein implicated in regulation of membrane protease activity
MTPADHTRFIVSWIGSIALVCIGVSAFLLYKGFQSGELLVGIASAAAGSLGTMVAMRRGTQPQNNSTTETTTTNITTP